MRILLDCRPIQVAGPDAERSRLILLAAAELSATEGIEWVLVMDHRYRRGSFPVLPGKVVIRRALPGRVGWRWWYGRQLQRVARQEQVDRVWVTGPIVAGMGVPVCLWAPERVLPLDDRGHRGYAEWFRSRLPQSLGHASAIVCYSERDRHWLNGIGPAGQAKPGQARLLTPFADESIQPLSAAEKERIKTDRTGGKEYFLADLADCGEADVVNVLKAFSLFKKRQRSGMQLVLAGGAGVLRGMEERLTTYKYRQDVDWSGEVPAGAAYAVLLPVEGRTLGTKMLNRWKAGVPVIAAGGGLLEEMAQGAALEVAPGDPASLAEQLMRIYKQEDLRQELIHKGLERLKIYSRENFLQVLRLITEIAAC